MGILIARIRRMRAELRELEARLDDAADCNWEIREAQERVATFLEAQDDLIVRATPRARSATERLALAHAGKPAMAAYFSS